MPRPSPCSTPASRSCCGSAPTDEPPQAGKVMAHNPCLSGGTLEIYLEPRHPPPRMAVVGDGPIARALRTHRAGRRLRGGRRRRARARRPRRRLARPETRPPRWAPRCRPASTTSGSWRARSAGPSVVGSARRRGGRAHRHPGRVGHRRPHAGGGRTVDLRRRDRPASSTLGPAGSRVRAHRRAPRSPSTRCAG